MGVVTFQPQIPCSALKTGTSQLLQHLKFYLPAAGNVPQDKAKPCKVTVRENPINIGVSMPNCTPNKYLGN